jgi:hypothetical protein
MGTTTGALQTASMWNPQALSVKPKLTAALLRRARRRTNNSASFSIDIGDGIPNHPRF